MDEVNVSASSRALEVIYDAILDSIYSRCGSLKSISLLHEIRSGILLDAIKIEAVMS